MQGVVEYKESTRRIVQKFDGVFCKSLMFAGIGPINGFCKPCSFIGHGVEWVMIIVKRGACDSTASIVLHDLLTDGWSHIGRSSTVVSTLRAI